MVVIWLYSVLFDPSMDIAMATNFRMKIGKIGLLIYVHHLDVPKRSGILQFRFQNIYLQRSAYIV